MKKILALTILFSLGLSSCKYEDGPIMSFRTKQNRVAHRIGKYWKSDKYTLKMGQEGYALHVIGQEGFIDNGDWDFNNTKDEISFNSVNNYSNFKMRIKQLQHRKMKLEGAFPFDDEPQVHQFELNKTIESLDK